MLLHQLVDWQRSAWSWMTPLHVWWLDGAIESLGHLSPVPHISGLITRGSLVPKTARQSTSPREQAVIRPLLMPSLLVSHCPKEIIQPNQYSKVEKYTPLLDERNYKIMLPSFFLVLNYNPPRGKSSHLVADSMEHTR